MIYGREHPQRTARDAYRQTVSRACADLRLLLARGAIMSLYDNSSREKQVRHVLKHFFCVAERYWDLTGDLASWLARWRILQAADALDPNRTERVERALSSRHAVD